LATFGAEEGGYFTYRIILGTPGMKFFNIIVDPGNGQILETQELSQKELRRCMMNIQPRWCTIMVATVTVLVAFPL
jgi:hypothetical protein